MSNKLIIKVRAFPAQIERTGPRQLTGRLVPYDVPADVADELPDGGYDFYREGFRPGAFRAQTEGREKGSFSKISLVHRHDRGGIGYLGPFLALREEADGLYGDVAIVRSKADDVQDLLDNGVGDLSVEFRLPLVDHTEIGDDGVRWRTRAHLDQVALEAKGAYTSAQVLAYRAEVDEQQREEAELAEAVRQVEAETAERRRRWEELTGRLDAEKVRQDELMRAHGVTRPGGFGTVTR
jgi:HK97 family phage prohead protease